MILHEEESKHMTIFTHNGIKVATLFNTVQYNVRKYRVQLHFQSNYEKVFFGLVQAKQYITNEFKQFIQKVNGASERRFLFINPVSTCFMNSFTPESDWIDGCIVVDLFESRITFDGETWEEIQ